MCAAPANTTETDLQRALVAANAYDFVHRLPEVC